MTNINERSQAGMYVSELRSVCYAAYTREFATLYNESPVYYKIFRF